MVAIPARLRAKAGLTRAGRVWLASLPELCRRSAERWALDLGKSFDHCHVSLVVAAERDGDALVLKVPLPATVELTTLAATARSTEAEALRVWAGDGVVRLLEHDPESGAMLIERCVPGHGLDLHDGGSDAADEVAAGLLHRLHAVTAPTGIFDRLTDLTDHLATVLPQRFDQAGAPFDRDLLGIAATDLRLLSAPVPGEVLLHGDFHLDNILAAGREPWLGIDPLPMIGDPAYDLVQYLLFRKGDLADPATQWWPVIRRSSALVGVDPDRVLAWTFARLVSDAVSASLEGTSTDELETRHGDLWTARLIRSFRG